MASNFPVDYLDFLWQIEDVGQLRVAKHVEFGHNDFGNPMPSKGRSATGIARIWIRPSELLLGMLVWSPSHRSSRMALRWAARRPRNHLVATRCRATMSGKPLKVMENYRELNVTVPR